MLDKIAYIFDTTCRQSIRTSFPRTDFSRGITKRTMVECSEHLGALFLISVFIMQAEGWEVINKHFFQLDAVFRTMESLFMS
jgi:hypothetical protein